MPRQSRSAPDPAADLRAQLKLAVDKGIPGISVAIASADAPIWTYTTGCADIDARTPIRADHLFGIGSITKTFVAVVILQLVQSGRLRLEWTPEELLGAAVEGIGNAECATLAQLLNHTSGIRSWEDEPTWIREGRGASLDPKRLWGKQDPLASIRGKPPIAPPAAGYSYSNTNHTLLGLIIEKVTGQEAMTAIRERILTPLALRDIYLEGFEPLPQDRLPHRYHWATCDFRRDAGVNPSFPEVRPGLIDASASNLSVEWTAGGMVATATDLVRYGRALRDGELLSAESMRFLTDWQPAAGRRHAQVGHGVFRWSYPHGEIVVGHDGGVLGFSANLYWIKNGAAVVAAMCNVGTMHAGEVANSLAETVKGEQFLQSVRELASH